MSDWKLTQECWDKLEELERREDAGENVWNLKADAPPRLDIVAPIEAAKVSTGSMKSKAIAVYNNLTDKSRQSVIKSLISELGMKQVTASTYSSNLTSGRWS